MPQADTSKPLEIGIKMFLISIMEFDEIREKLTTAASFHINWTDPRMEWDMAENDGVLFLFLPITEVWVPNFLVNFNPSEKFGSLSANWQYVHFYAGGQANWYPGSILSTSCAVDVYKFPFDTQKCNFEFLCWGFESTVNITTTSDEIGLDYYSTNGQWTIKSTKSGTVDLPGPTNKIVFTVELERKPAYVVVNVIVPIIFLAFLNSLVFLLPVDSGERVSYSVTVLLAIAVFMTIVSDSLPKTSEPIAFIAYVLMAELGLCVLITVLTIINMIFCYKSDNKPLPFLIKRLLTPSPCCKSKVQPNDDMGDQGDKIMNIKKTFKDPNTLLHTFHSSHQKNEGEVEENPTWKDFSQFLDKLCFSLFTLFNCIVFILYFAVVLG